MHDTKPKNAQTCSLDTYIIITHLMYLHVSVRKGPSSWNKMKIIRHKTKSVTFVYS